MNLAFSIETVEFGEVYTAGATAMESLSAGDTAFVTMGKTSGGGAIRQEIEEFIVESDQSADPEHIGVMKAPKTLTLNLLDAKAENLALAFGGTVSTAYETGTYTSKMVIPALPEGIEKSIRITTREVGTAGSLMINIARCKFKGNAELTLNKDNVSTIPLEGVVLAPGDTGAIPISALWA